MKQLLLRLERGLMYLLVLMPAVALIMRLITAQAYFGPALWTGLTALICVLALLPPFIGNYTETEVIRYEGGLNRGNDPNPDRESRHEIIKQGHRFPLRMAAYILYLLLSLFVLLLLPKRLFMDAKPLLAWAFAGIVLVLEFMCMLTVSGSYCFWTELPGILVGFLSYAGIALYLHLSKADNASLSLFIGICSIAYIFMGGVSLNRQSLSVSSAAGQDAQKRHAPRQVVRRNRRIVLGFAAFVTLTSFVGPIREGAMWLWARITDLLKWVAWLLRGGQEVSEGNLEAILEQQAGPRGDLTQLQQEAEELGGLSIWDKIFLYGFFGLVGVGLIWIIVSWLIKLSKKLSQLLERFAHSVNEGYYDEKENLMDASEARKRLRDALRERVKGLFTRPTPWEKLNGRERARRLVQTLYRRRSGKIGGIRTLTAREALSLMNLKPDARQRACEAYDRARYSPHDVDAAQMDALRKEIRP